MSEKLPSAWPDYYTPTSAEWRDGFANDITQATSAATAAAQSITGPLAAQVTGQATTIAQQGQSIAANTTAIGTQATTLSTHASQIAANAASASSALSVATAAVPQSTFDVLSASATRNPAIGNQDMGGFNIVNLAAGGAADAAVRLGQVGWETIVSNNAVNTSGIYLTTYSAFRRFRIEWTALAAPTSNAGTLFAQFGLSSDFYSPLDTAAHYVSGTTTRNLSGSSYSSVTATYIPLASGATNSQLHEGYIEFSYYGNGWWEDTMTGNSGVQSSEGWLAYTGGTVAKVLLGINASTFSGGIIRLLGWRA